MSFQNMFVQVIGFFILGISLFFIITVTVITVMVKNFKKAKGFNFGLKNLQIPNGIRIERDKTLNAYIPYKVAVNDILKNLALIKVSEDYVKLPGSSKVVFQMYPQLSWNESFDFKNSFLKCYSYSAIKNFNIFNYNSTSQYAAIKIDEGVIESYFTDGVMIITFNGKKFGYFDFNTRKVINNTNIEMGYFSVPETTKFRSITFEEMGVNYGKSFEIKADIFLRSSKTASILLQSSTVEEIELVKNRDKNMDFNMFSDLKVQSPEEAILVLGFGISFFALLENMRQDQPFVHSV